MLTVKVFKKCVNDTLFSLDLSLAAMEGLDLCAKKIR